MKQLMTLALTGAVVCALFAPMSEAKTKMGRSGWLGVYTQTIDADLAEAFKLSKDYGVVVNRVADDSPAEKAGLKRNDIITAMDGRKIQDDNDLLDYVSDARPDDTVALSVNRDGKEITVKAVLGDRRDMERSSTWSYNSDDSDSDDEDEADEWDDSDDAFWYDNSLRGLQGLQGLKALTRVRGGGYLGITMVEMNPDLGKVLGVTDGKGVLINDVVEDSPAEKAGLKSGDVIVSINGEKIDEQGDVSDIIGDMKRGDLAKIGIIRNKSSMTVDATVRGSYNTAWARTPQPDMAPMPPIAPRMRGLYRGSADDQPFDSKDMQLEMEKLRKELSELKAEMKKLKGN